MAKRKIKIRRTWGALKPITRVKQSKRIYSRKPSLRPEHIPDSVEYYD